MKVPEQLSNPTVFPQNGKGIPGAIISSAIILLNGISLTVIVKNRVLETKIKVCFIGHLLTDFLFGISTLVATQPELRRRFRLLCFINIYVVFIVAIATSMMTLVQSLDRFCVIRFTYSYTAWITARKMAVIIVFVYVFSLLSVVTVVYISHEEVSDCYLFTAGGKVVYVYLGSIFIVCLLSISCIYLYTGKALIRHSRQIRDTTVGQNVSAIITKEKRNIVTTALIVGLYILFYLPLIITMFWLIHFWENRVKLAEEYPINVVVLLYMANSVLNPIVYIWRLKSYRLQCRDTCLWLRELAHRP